GYSPHRHPPSFPTRRSSDLSTARLLRVAARRPALSRTERAPHRPHASSCCFFGCRSQRCAGLCAECKTVPLYSPPRRGEHRTRRSEEHTSELQSRENLVCRL